MLSEFWLDARNLKFYVFGVLYFSNCIFLAWKFISTLLWLAFKLCYGKFRAIFIFRLIFLCFKTSRSEESNCFIAYLHLVYYETIFKIFYEFWWLYILLLSSTSFLKENFRKFSAIHTHATLSSLALCNSISSALYIWNLASFLSPLKMLSLFWSLSLLWLGNCLQTVHWGPLLDSPHLFSFSVATVFCCLLSKICNVLFNILSPSSIYHSRTIPIKFTLPFLKYFFSQIFM